jgi:hypothetical protein
MKLSWALSIIFFFENSAAHYIRKSKRKEHTVTYETFQSIYFLQESFTVKNNLMYILRQTASVV